MENEKNNGISEKFYRSTVESGAHVVFWFSPDGQVSRVNRAACEFLGYSREDLIAKSVNDIIVDQNNDDWRQLISNLEECGTRLFESEMIKKSSENRRKTRCV
jgi:PAS domain S-box-containing protein